MNLFETKIKTLFETINKREKTPEIANTEYQTLGGGGDKGGYRGFMEDLSRIYRGFIESLSRIYRGFIEDSFEPQEML